MYMNMAQRLEKTVLFGLLYKVGSLGKISFIIGSFAASFSAAAIALPVAGSFVGAFGSSLIVATALVVRLLLGSSFSLHFLAYYIPGLFSAYYWSSQSALIRVATPALCMIAFCLHPTGSAAWMYSLYWLIPVALYLKKDNSVLTTALGSTFVAHAVGSVIWLYSVPMAPSAWMALIPMVALERSIFTLGMVGLHYAITTISAFLVSAKRSGVVSA